MNEEGECLVTDLDFERLSGVLDVHGDRAEHLWDGLQRAKVVPQQTVPANVVTMNSTVIYEDEGTGERREITLAYPHEASSSLGRVSVTAPIGAALLGRAVGDRARTPAGRVKSLWVIAVLYQPEAAGDFHL